MGRPHLAALKEILSQKLRRPASLAQVIAWAAETTRERFDPVKRAERSQAISSRKLPPPKSGRQPVRASVKHPIVLRDGMQCTHVSEDGRRCEQKRWLQLHHTIEVRKDGLNSVENLRTFCQGHHQMLHSRGGSHSS